MLETIDDTPYENLNMVTRLFTQTPYPEFDYIVTNQPYEFCANESLYTYLRKSNYWLKWVDVTPDLVLGYVREQIAILRFNNMNITRLDCIETLLRVFKWGSENPLDKIAFDTVLDTIDLVLEIDNFEDLITFTEKYVWYSDRIMKPMRIQGETWLQYTERIRAGKIRVKTETKNYEAKRILEEESYSIQGVSNGIIPTPQTLNQRTEIPVRKIKEVSEENKIWQTKTNQHLQKLQKIKESGLQLTQKELALELGITDRQIRKIIQ